MGYSDHGSKPKVTNISFASAGEQSHVFRPNVKKFDVSAKNLSLFVVSWVANGTSGNTRKTIPAGGGYFENYIKGILTLYIDVPNANNEVIEILEWESTD